MVTYSYVFPWLRGREQSRVRFRVITSGSVGFPTLSNSVDGSWSSSPVRAFRGATHRRHQGGVALIWPSAIPTADVETRS